MSESLSVPLPGALSMSVIHVLPQHMPGPKGLLQLGGMLMAHVTTVQRPWLAVDCAATKGHAGVCGPSAARG